MAHAFGMGAVAMGRDPIFLHVAAAAAAGISGKPPCFQGSNAGGRDAAGAASFVLEAYRNRPVDVPRRVGAENPAGDAGFDRAHRKSSSFRPSHSKADP